MRLLHAMVAPRLAATRTRLAAWQAVTLTVAPVPPVTLTAHLATVGRREYLPLPRRPPALGMSTDVTALVLAPDWSPAAAEALIPAVYDELRRIARHHLRGEAVGHTLTTTALVHEAYLRLVNARNVPEENRTRFLVTASVAMRRVLVDYARAHRAEKRGGGVVPVELHDALQATTDDTGRLLELDEALQRLAAVAPRLAQVVECRFFGGMTEDDTAAALGISLRTVRRDWLKAKGWLAVDLARD